MWGGEGGDDGCGDGDMELRDSRAAEEALSKAVVADCLHPMWRLHPTCREVKTGLVMKDVTRLG